MRAPAALAMAFLHDGGRPPRVRLDITGTVTVVLGVALIAVFVVIERRTAIAAEHDKEHTA